MPKENSVLLLDIYRKNPCQVLPNAFWKTERVMEHADLFIERNLNGELKSLAIQENSRLLSYWCTKSDGRFSQQVDFQNFLLALVHDDCHQTLQNLNLSKKIAFFRIIHVYTVQFGNHLLYCPVCRVFGILASLVRG